MTSAIDVAFGVDGNYAPHLSAVIRSIVRHAPGAKFRFIVLYEDFDAERRQACESVAPDAEFVWTEISDRDMPGFDNHLHFTRAILFRLGLPHLAPADCRRVIYLDADIIVTDDIRKLWSIDLGGAALGAVEDAYVDPVAFAARWGVAQRPARYFNSGVLLVDLEQVRRDGLFDAALRFVAEHGDKLTLTDQDALNFAFAGRWHALSVVWNVQRHMTIPSLFSEVAPHNMLGAKAPAIVHYTGPEKPWLPGVYHPWAWLYWSALSETQFTREVATRYRVKTGERFKMWVRWMRRRWKPAG